jgi:hypothetical protein
VRNPGRRRSSRTCSSLLHGQTRFKYISTILSGIFLTTILTVCKLHHSRNSGKHDILTRSKICHWLLLSIILPNQFISSSSLLL